MKKPIIASTLVVLCVGGSLSGLIASRAGASGLTPSSPVPAAAAPTPSAEPTPVVPEAAPSASADPGAPADGPPSLAAQVYPGEKTKAPKHAEWRAASAVRLTRTSEPRCKAKRIREWIRIDCAIDAADSVALLAGSREGVEIWTALQDPWGATIVFPARAGDRRVFQINESAGKYGVNPSALVSEEWVVGEDAPLITVQRVL